jgi:YVTN family beta-propeller protein
VTATGATPQGRVEAKIVLASLLLAILTIVGAWVPGPAAVRGSADPMRGPGTAVPLLTPSSTFVQGPFGLAYDSGTGMVYVADFISGNVSVISASTDLVAATISLGKNADPADVAYDSAKGELYVSDLGSKSVSVISDSTNTVTDTIAVGLNPTGVAYDSDKGEIFVANQNSGNVTVINDTTDHTVATIGLGAYTVPMFLAYDPAKGQMFVTTNGGDGNGGTNVSVISGRSNTVVANTTVGPDLEGIAYDPAKGQVMVADGNGANVSLISGSTDKVVRNISLSPRGAQAFAVVYDGGTHDFFVTNFVGPYSHNVTVISSSNDTILKNIPVGLDDGGAAYVPAKGEIFISNLQSDNVSVINDTNLSVVDTIPIGPFSLTVQAPYVGAHTFTEYSTGKAGNCTTSEATVAGNPKASKSNGSISVGSTSCATSPNGSGSRTASLSTKDGFLGPLFTAYESGSSKIVYTWQISWNANGSSSGLGSRAAVRISLLGNLFDQTTGKWALGGAQARGVSDLVFYGSTTHGPFATGGKYQTFSVSLMVNLVLGDVYEFSTGLYTNDTSVGASGCTQGVCTAGTADGDVDVDTGADFAQVLSMNVE